MTTIRCCLVVGVLFFLAHDASALAVHGANSTTVMPDCRSTPDDCTDTLQGILNDTTVTHIHFDNRYGPFVTLPLFLRRATVHITCDSSSSAPAADGGQGTLILAKRWAYNSTHASLLTLAEGADNVKVEGDCRLRMWRHDYANKQWYRKGEWRMAINTVGVHNLDLVGITLEESGGDGIYLGGTCNDNVNIINVTSRNNYRQGISVICAKDLTISGSRFEGTRGTNPACGIDMEPNSPHQSLVNVVIHNNTFYNNSGCGISLSTHAFEKFTDDVSVKITNNIIDESDGFGLLVSVPLKGPEGGYVTVEDLSVSNTKQFGLFGMAKNITPHMTFTNTVLRNTSYGHYIAPIAFYPEFHGITFDTDVYETEKRMVFYYQEGGSVVNPTVDGHIRVHSPLRYDCLGDIPKDVRKTLNITCDIEP